MDATQTEVRYGEGRPETESAQPVVEQTNQAFATAENEVTNSAGSTPEQAKSVYDAHKEAWNKIVAEVPEDQRNGINMKTGEFWNSVAGRVDDVSARMIDAVKDNEPGALIYRGIGKLRGVEVPTGQYEAMRKAKVSGASEVQAEKMKQNVDNHETFKRIIPGGKVLDIADRIIGPKMG